MKIILVSILTPASENIRGTSALPYHLRMGAILNDNVLETFGTSVPLGRANVNGNQTLYENDKEIFNANVNANDNKNQFEIYTFNNNGLSDEKIAEVEKELHTSIKKVPLPKWYQWVFKFRLLFIRLFMKYPLHNYIKLSQQFVDEIISKKPDVVWVYGAELSRVVGQFDGLRRIHTLPDSEALYYYRMLGQRFVTHDWKQFWRSAFMYPKFLALERNYSTDPMITYHLVGEEDANFLRKMNPGINARFLRHPHYEISKEISYENQNENEKKGRRFHQPKIKVLIAGQYNYYMKEEADLLLEQICNVNDNANDNMTSYNKVSKGGGIVNVPVPVPVIREHFVFTFLGKGWEKHVESMRNVGYEVEHITFAPDYIEEIVKHDIQITPIAIGTGTKGKVLDALANGLLVIGTPYAMENIAVENGVSCVVYQKPEEVIKILLDIPKNIQKYEEMAAEGCRQVLKHHDRGLIAKQLFC